MDLTGFTLNKDIMDLVGVSLKDRRKVLKQIARDHQATLTYWIHRSSDEFVLNWIRSKKRDDPPPTQYPDDFRVKKYFGRVELMNVTIPTRHAFMDELQKLFGTDTNECPVTFAEFSYIPTCYRLPKIWWSRPANPH
tara:strand:+ start:423 stop:833 length:411 start_codon:yes stop_codon:yes gene_type:complete